MGGSVNQSPQQSVAKGSPAMGEPGQSSPPPGSPSNGKGQPSQQVQPLPAQLMQGTPPGQAQNTITSGQPIMGQPNQYMNTVGANTQPLFNNQAYQPTQHGKGKG